jgi:hypothetical protein
MAKARKAISTFKDLPIEKTVEFVGLIHPEYGGSRWNQDERNQTWDFVATLVAWQANEGPVLREELFIRKKQLDSPNAVTLVRQTPKGRMIQFTGRRPRRLGASQNYVTLVGPIRKPKKPFTIEQTTRKPKPKSYADKVLGRLRFDGDSGVFVCQKTFCSSKLTIEFETEEVEELQAMLPVARKLWEQRDKWFKRWQDKAYRQYVDCMVDEWWQGDRNLTRSLFNKHLGWPCGLTFSIEEGSVQYCLTGLSDDLYGDHGIDGVGTGISDMEIIFA